MVTPSLPRVCVVGSIERFACLLERELALEEAAASYFGSQPSW